MTAEGYAALEAEIKHLKSVERPRIIKQIADARTHGDQVMFGATVTLQDEDTDDKVKYRIVGETEAEVRSGKISITSPLARALLGKRKKDIVEVSTPGGGKSYKVVKVEFK